MAAPPHNWAKLLAAPAIVAPHHARVCSCWESATCNFATSINVMLVILLLFTLCSADSDLQLQVHQLQLHSTVQGEDTWLYASESWYLVPVFLPFDFCFRKCPGCMWCDQPLSMMKGFLVLCPCRHHSKRMLCILFTCTEQHNQHGHIFCCTYKQWFYHCCDSLWQFKLL